MAKDLALISRAIFYWLSAALAIFIALEIFWPNIILAYFNLNYLVILWLVSALFSLIKNKS